MEADEIPEDALSRAEIIAVNETVAALTASGCSCAVRLRLRRCPPAEPNHVHVETYHADTCPFRKVVAAPFN